MKALFLCPSSGRTGTWFRCFYLARALARRDHDITLVSVSADRRLLPRAYAEDGVRIVETPRGWGGRFSHHGTRLPADIAVRLAMAVGGSYDLVHSFAHHLNSMLPGLAARLLPGRSALVVDWDDLWAHGGILGERPAAGLWGRLAYDVDAWSERHLKRFGHGVTVVSGYLRDRAQQDGVPVERILFLPNGAPADVIAPDDKLAHRARLGLPSTRSLLVFVGFGQWDVDLIFDALAQIARGVPEPPLVVVTGPHPDLLAHQAAARGVTHLVRLMGHVSFPVLQSCLAAADVGLLPYADSPTNQARWPIKLGDYLAAGLPVVTCDVGEMGRFVRQHKVGVATQPDAAGFAAGIQELVCHPDLGRLGRHARAVAEDFSWDRLAADAEHFYDECRARA